MISISNLAKSYGDRTLFSNVSVQINSGDRCGLVGANGSGKTTFAQGFAEGLGIFESVVSPTFKLVIISLDKILFINILRIRRLKPK